MNLQSNVDEHQQAKQMTVRKYR